MRSFSLRAATATVVALGWLGRPTGAQQQQPESTISTFPHLPSKIFYFDDTTSILYHDPLLQNVYHSDNEGKSWDLVNGIPDGEAHQLVEHPTDNEVAFILTRDTTHYVTYNRGKTWQTFTVPDASPSFLASPLSFHANEKGWILYQGTICKDTGGGGWGGQSCWDQTFYTQDAFRTPPKPMLSQTTQCSFAHQASEFVSPNPSETNSLVFCTAFYPFSDDDSKKGEPHSIADSRLFASSDWFNKFEMVDFGLGKRAQGVVGLGVIKKFVVAALRPETADGEMNLFVTTDGQNWAKAKFPHSSAPSLKENAYTIVESTKHSMAIDVLVHPTAAVGDLFVSNSNGTEFTISLQDTNRNQRGIVDYENLIGLEGIGIANVVRNREEVVGWGKEKEIRSKITYNEGRKWEDLQPPSRKANGDDWACDLRDPEKCSLHLHSVSTPHNYGKVFSSTAPGYVMGVGSVGAFLMPYEDCDTFISHDAGVSWHMAFEDASKYEFGDQGSIIVAVNDEAPTSTIKYSWDAGKTWAEYDIGITMRALLLMTVPDSTSQKFLLLGSRSRKEAGKDDRHATVFLDFAAIRKRQCGQADLEKWYARPTGQECLMGHKQWYMRKKLNADCYVGNKFTDPVGQEDNCPCSAIDFECDFNFVLQDGECVLKGPEPVPAGTCVRPTDTFEGSSGYRLIPGNTCDRSKGIKKDEAVRKSCSQARPADGEVSHQMHEFGSNIVQHFYFGDSHTVVVQLADSTIWQSSNEGFAWKQLYEKERFLAMALHASASDRAYLITDSKKVYYTTDTGKNWYTFTPPTDPNGLNIPIIDFHPTKNDWLIWTGQVDCNSMSSTSCRAVSHYSTNNGRSWKEIETYVKSCTWAKVHRLQVDERMILCEAYTSKSGSQRSNAFSPKSLQIGENYYSKKKDVFKSIVGYTTFSEYLIVAELDEGKGTLNLQVSLDGVRFAEGRFPPGMGIENKAYTVLESSTDSVFLHVTTSSKQGAEFGSIFKSNSNGTYYGISIDHVNRNDRGFVDFEKMIGLDGVAVVNVLTNPEDAAVNGRKKLQTRITHNDGGSWKPMTPPAKDSLGQAYDCASTACSLQIHGYTARRDPKATYSSPSAAGLMMAVGNVGEELAAYTDSDTYLTRDAGFTWEEVHKDAHLFEFGDYGSIIVIVNDEVPTSEILYSTNEGLSWSTYDFGETLHIASIQTVPSDTSRKFLLFGSRPRKNHEMVTVYVDFSSLTTRKCEQKIEDLNHDDFELWSPSESREEQCLFGRQTMFHRRIRDRDCYVGEAPNLNDRYKFVKNCTCTPSDFECEFNYHRDDSGNCVLFPNATPLLALSTEEEQCPKSPDGFWYERTNVRKIPYSSCEGGARPDRGKKHECPNVYVGAAKSWLFWATVIASPFLIAGMMGAWWVKKRIGPINLGGSEGGAFGGPSSLGALDILASIPYFIIGSVTTSLAWAEDQFSRFGFVEKMRSRRGYRSVSVDDDAEILRGAYDED